MGFERSAAVSNLMTAYASTSAAGGRVDEQEVAARGRARERRGQPRPLRRGQRRQLAHAVCRRNHVDAERARHRDLVERAIAVEHVTQVGRRREPQAHVDIAEREVSIEERHAAAHPRDAEFEEDRPTQVA